MKYRLVLSSAVHQETMEAAAHIATNTSAPAAARWLDGLEALFESLREMPERFPVAREDPRFRSGTVRSALYHRHRVLFTVDRRVVRVLHIRHGMRGDLTDI